MTKFPINERVLVLTTEKHDFYIMKTSKVWYIEAFPIGTLNHYRKTMGGFTTKKEVLNCLEIWKGWLG